MDGLMEMVWIPGTRGFWRPRSGGSWAVHHVSSRVRLSLYCTCAWTLCRLRSGVWRKLDLEGGQSLVLTKVMDGWPGGWAVFSSKREPVFFSLILFKFQLTFTTLLR